MATLVLVVVIGQRKTAAGPQQDRSKHCHPKPTQNSHLARINGSAQPSRSIRQTKFVCIPLSRACPDFLKISLHGTLPIDAVGAGAIDDLPQTHDASIVGGFSGEHEP